MVYQQHRKDDGFMKYSEATNSSTCSIHVEFSSQHKMNNCACALISYCFSYTFTVNVPGRLRHFLLRGRFARYYGAAQP